MSSRPTHELPFELASDLERRIASDPEWREGIEFGRPRPGHPEGQIKFHIAAVLDNVVRWYGDSPLEEKMRLIALIHDSFKHRVDPDVPRTGENHHAMRARRFAESYLTDGSVLDIIELHDEAHNAWKSAGRDGDWEEAQSRAQVLLARLGENLELYVAFYRCDNQVEGKSPEGFDWFQQFVSERDVK